MSKFYTIKIKCETPDVKQAMSDILMLSKAQMEHHIGQMLHSKGISSDIKVKVQGDEITITQKSGDKGIVLISSGLGYEAVAYDTLPVPSKYMVVRNGSVLVYAKLADNIDQAIARYPDLEEAITNINSNDVEDAYRNLTKSPETTQSTLKVNVAEEIGNTSEAV